MQKVLTNINNTGNRAFLSTQNSREPSGHTLGSLLSRFLAKAFFSLWSVPMQLACFESLTRNFTNTALCTLQSIKRTKVANSSKDAIARSLTALVSPPSLRYLHRSFILSVEPGNLKEDVGFDEESLPCIKITLDFFHNGTFCETKTRTNSPRKIRADEQYFRPTPLPVLGLQWMT